VSTAVDKQPKLATASSFAQPLVILSPPPQITVVDYEQFQWTEEDMSAVASFNLYYGFLSPHEYDYAITGITNLDCIISNLVPGVTYYMAASAVDTNGVESDLSDQYVFLMPTTLEMGFTFGGPATNVSVQSSNDLMTWQASRARPRTNGLWRIDVDPGTPAEFYRGIGQAAPAL
jgi:hypothetical protein